MGGITSGTGLISGINSGQIIQQLLAIEARPKQLAQQRLVQLQGQQAAFLDLSNRLSALKDASSKFRSSRIFESATATSSDDKILTATATAGAASGSYTLFVDRLVSTQQSLSRGLSDRNQSAVGSTALTFEPDAARLETDTSLSILNGGEGIARGSIRITDSAGRSATIDLSRVGTVSEVLEKINTADGIRVKARVDGNKFVLDDSAGGSGTVSVESLGGSTTASSLGLSGAAVGSVLTGTSVYGLSASTSIRSLRDGLGIRFNTVVGLNTFDFRIKTKSGEDLGIDIGDVYEDVGTPPKQTKTAGEVSTFGQLKDRIEAQTAGKVSVVINTDGTGFNLVDNTTGGGTTEVVEARPDQPGAATDLGLVGTSPSGTIQSRRLLAGINTVLASSLRGGRGLTDGAFEITARNGANFLFDVTTGGSFDAIVREIGAATGGVITAALDKTGTSLVLTDHSGGTGNLIVTGGGADQLGVKTPDAGVAAATFTGARSQKQYISEATLVSSLNSGAGIGTGEFELIGPGNVKSTVRVGSDQRTVGDLIRLINSRNVGVRARINDNGDGIQVESDGSVATPGTKISIKDLSGNAAARLNLAGTAEGVPNATNVINGSFERKVTLSAADTLNQIVEKINLARVGVNATVVSDGLSATPFRLRLTSTSTGEAGRYIVTGSGADLGLEQTARGNNSRVFFGSDNPAEGTLVESTTNSISSAVDGVTIDLKGRSTSAVTLNVAKDNAAIAKGVQDFADAYNAVISRLTSTTSYDSETEKKGVLLGDATALDLRNQLNAAIQKPAVGASGQFRVLSQVGVTIGKGGELKVDTAKLQRAIDADPQGVTDLFAGYQTNDRPPTIEITPGVTVTNTNPFTYRTLGVAEQISLFVDGYTDASKGRLTKRNETLNTAIQGQNDRISSFDARLTAKQAILERQFANLESVLAKLQQQQQSIGNIGASR